MRNDLLGVTARPSLLGRIITATDEGCIGSDPQSPCESRLQVFLPRHGRLMNIADIPLERRAFATSTELGMKGKTEYRMTAAGRRAFKPGSDDSG